MYGINTNPGLPMTGVQGFGTLGIDNRRSGAVLFLMAPRQFTEQFRRPFEFQFTPNFAQNLTEAVVASAENGSPVPIARVLNDPRYAHEVAPSSIQNGYRVGANAFSYSWTFILSIDNAPVSGMQLVSGRATRSIYSGICVGDPINPRTGTTNNACVLSITHAVHISKIRTGNFGGYDDRLINSADYDIINGQTFSVNAEPTNYFKLEAEDAFYANTGFNYEHSIGNTQPADILVGENNAISNCSADILINSRASSPMMQKQLVVGAIVKGADFLGDSNLGGSLNGADGIIGSNAGFGNMIGQYLADPVPATVNGALEEGAVQLSMIIDKYRPRVEMIKHDNIFLHSVKPQDHDSMSNFYSAIIGSALPPIVTNYGLTDLAFKYRYMEGQPPVFELIHIASAVDGMTDAELRQRFQATLRMLEKDIFPILYAGQGDFDLMAKVETTGMTHITLNFMCQNSFDQGVYEIPSILGGYNSMVIGKESSLIANATGLYDLASRVEYGLSPQQLNASLNMSAALSAKQRIQQNVPNVSEMMQYQNHPAYAVAPPPNFMDVPQHPSVQTPVQNKPQKFSGDEWA